MAVSDAAIAYRLIKHQGNRGGGSVAVGGQVAQHPFVGHGEAFGHRIQDALVGLVQQ